MTRCIVPHESCDEPGRARAAERLAELVQVDRRAARLGPRALHGVRPRRRGRAQRRLAALPGNPPGRAGRSDRCRGRLRWAFRDFASPRADRGRFWPPPDGGRVRDWRPSGLGGARNGGGRAAHVAGGSCGPSGRSPRIPALAWLHAGGDARTCLASPRVRLLALGRGAHRGRLPRGPARRLRRHDLAQAT
jgi:hypothetical protein